MAPTLRRQRQQANEAGTSTVKERIHLDDVVDDEDNDEGTFPAKPRYLFDGMEYPTYEAMVDAKRKRNHDMLVKSGLVEAASALRKQKKTSATKTTTTTTKRAKHSETNDSSVKRRSNRLAGLQSDGLYVEDERNGKYVITGSNSMATSLSSSSTNDHTAFSEEEQCYYQNRINDGSDLTIRQAMELMRLKQLEENTIANAEVFVKDVLPSLPCSSKQVAKDSPKSVVMSWEATLKEKIESLSINDENSVAKLTPNRIYSLAVHPSTDRLIVCAGDKEGAVGIWDVDAAQPEGDKSDKNNLHMFRLHNYPVCCVHWTKDNGIISASYDGSVRKLDVASGVFQEIFATYDGDSKYAEDLGFGLEDVADGRSFWVQSLTSDHRSDPDMCFFLSTSVGTAIHVDLRVGHRKVSFQETLSDKKINTLSLHPNGHALASAGNDGVMRIWDVRKFGTNHPPQCFAQLSVGYSISSAYFSPSGSTLVTTTHASTLDIVKDAHLSSKLLLQPSKSVRHDNMTGRWLCTFMAKWHPTLDIFVVGSMSKPRRVELFDANGNLLRGVQGDALTAVASRCCFHPSEEQLVVVGGNSSGRVSVIR